MGVDAQLERLTVSGDIRRIDIWSRDGRIVYSNVASLRGHRLSIGPDLAAAFSGESVTTYATAADGRVESSAALPALYLEVFVPIRGVIDGNPIGVYGVYQDARLIEERIDATRSSVFVAVLIASSFLVGLIWLAFGGASRVLAGQNRRLSEQAVTERLLLVDLQRSEERFRSLVRNASDCVVVLAEDGRVRFESPAVERILGYKAEARVGELALDGVHVEDRPLAARRLAEVSAHGAPAQVRARERQGRAVVDGRPGHDRGAFRGRPGAQHAQIERRDEDLGRLRRDRLAAATTFRPIGSRRSPPVTTRSPGGIGEQVLDLGIHAAQLVGRPVVQGLVELRADPQQEALAFRHEGYW